MSGNGESPAGTIGSGSGAAVIGLIERAVRSYLGSIGAGDAPFEVDLQTPRKPEHGDWATSVAMKLAKTLRRKPLEIAQGIVDHFEENELVAKPEVAPPGFINLRAGAGSAAQTLDRVLGEGDRFGRTNTYAGEKCLVEFVSANPTGPLHIGHGRNAVVGDTLARIYDAAGYAVEREYYYNDAGVQMTLLGRSLLIRYQQACGMDVPFPEEGYKGDYMRDIAAQLRSEIGDSKKDSNDIPFFTKYAADHIMEFIRRDCAALGIGFDRYFSETSLHTAGKVTEVIERLKAKGRVYEQEGALWLKTTDCGDEKDRVVRKSDGTNTYLAPDIAYHEDKFQRGYSRMVNVLGADHHSYVVRLKAAIKGLGYDPEKLHPVLIQMVGVIHEGEAKKLSTRGGDFIPLSEILNELGPDIVRFFFLMRATDSQLVFDIDLAKKQSMDNPYYYIQYAHARCNSLLRKAEEVGVPWKPGEKAKAERLAAPEERDILLAIDRLSSAVDDAAKKDEPLPVVNYLRDLATTFHGYFSAGNRDAQLRCIQPEDRELTQARLTLIVALRQTLANGLRILGLTPMERL